MYRRFAIVVAILLLATACGETATDPGGGGSPTTESSVAKGESTGTDANEEADASQTSESSVASEVGTTLETTTTTADVGGTLDDPVTPGTWARVGDVDVAVLAVDTDAAERVLAENEFNDEPEPGNRFVMWTVALANASDDAIASLGEVTFTVVGPSAVGYDLAGDCGVVPDALDMFRDVFPGGSITGNLCWEVAEDDAEDLVLLADEFSLFGERVAFGPAESTTPLEVTYPAPVPPDEDGSVGSRGNPYPVGETVTVGDWDVVVTGVTDDATDVVMGENEFNDPPVEGNQFMTASIEATYSGSESAVLGFALSFNLVGDRAVSYTIDDTCGVVPDEIDTFAEVFPGGKTNGVLCWSVRTDEVDSLVMYVEDSFDLDGERFFLALR